eukprot:11324548-Alexandrium_andersonii.AAC.1
MVVVGACTGPAVGYDRPHFAVPWPNATHALSTRLAVTAGQSVVTDSRPNGALCPICFGAK